MSEVKLIKREDAMLLAIGGFKVGGEEYTQFFVRTPDNKMAKILGLDGKETCSIYKKLINGELVEIPESLLPAGIKITIPGEKKQEAAKLEKAFPTIEQSVSKIESICLKLDTILATTSVMEKACDGENDDFSIMLRDINNKIYEYQGELSEISTNLNRACQEKEQSELILV